MKNESLVKKAIEMRDFITTKEVNRDGEPETIYIRTPDSPEWVQDVIHKAHGDMLPDDIKYDFVVLALDAIIANDGDLDRIEFEPSIYNRDLLNWLHSAILRAAYVDEAAEDYGLGPEIDTYTRIGYGQVREKREVLDIVASELASLEE